MTAWENVNVTTENPAGMQSILECEQIQRDGQVAKFCAGCVVFLTFVLSVAGFLALEKISSNLQDTEYLADRTYDVPDSS